jgi:lipopolysaccharide/colanic/teichoic acid biosynthesis glycosyltransferase
MVVSDSDHLIRPTRPQLPMNGRTFDRTTTNPGLSEPTIAPSARWYLPIKRAADVTLSLLLLVIAGPMILVSAALVKLTSRGPAFYHQVRLGKDGRPFNILKLRTMVENAEAATGPVWSTGKDSRITPLGDLLRKTHIDEFPQLLNVLKGEMSLVGPRPERPEFVAKLEWEIPYYRERLQVHPGITGLAQLKLPPDSDIESVRRKVVHDLYYVRFVGPWLDLRLLYMTGWSLTVELVRYAWKGFSLPSQQVIEKGFQQAVSGAPAPTTKLESAGIESARMMLEEPVPELVEFRDALE